VTEKDLVHARGQLASRFKDVVFCHGPVVKLNVLSKLFRGHTKAPADPASILRSVYVNVLDTVVSGPGCYPLTRAKPCLICSHSLCSGHSLHFHWHLPFPER
jgi:hypothetical protein